MFRTTTPLRVLFIAVLIMSMLGWAGAASAGTDVWTSNGPHGGIIYALAYDL